MALYSAASLAPLPCDILPQSVPSIYDQLSAPTTNSLLPQVLALTPRGAAWGRDEAGNGQGASPVLLGLWRVVAASLAEIYTAAFETASQAIPSAITWSLDDWEVELGLPDSCVSIMGGDVARLAAIRAKWMASGNASPAYFICYARGFGSEITIEEPVAFTCDQSVCAGEDQTSDLNLTTIWIVRPQKGVFGYFYPDLGQVDVTPLESFVVDKSLECAMRKVSPTHTHLIFDYSQIAA